MHKEYVDYTGSKDYVKDVKYKGLVMHMEYTERQDHTRCIQCSEYVKYIA